MIYTDEGVFSEYLVLPKNPDAVLMDTEVIVNAPARLLVSGMGDALATYFEARACIAADKTNMPGGHATKAALALAELCYDTLLEDGLKAFSRWRRELHEGRGKHRGGQHLPQRASALKAAGLAQPTPSTTGSPSWKSATGSTTGRRSPSGRWCSSSSRTPPRRNWRK